MARSVLRLMALSALVLTMAPASAMAIGEITQKLEAAGCISVSGADGEGQTTCTDGRALRLVTTVAVSPDGRSVYVTSHEDDAIAIFDRAADGTLTQKPGVAGCVSETGSDGEGGTCTDGRALEGAAMVAVSPDGKSVYLTTFDRVDQSDDNGNAVAIFDRAPDGALTQKAGAAGCVSQTGADGAGAMTCANGRAIDEAAVVSFSPDGASVYVTGFDRPEEDDDDDTDDVDNNSVAIFDRAANGTLTQKAGAAGCISELGDDNDGGFTCTVGRAFGGAGTIAISPDGKSAYMTGFGYDDEGSGLLVFDRSADGSLTQKPGTAGCLSQTGADGQGGSTCADARLLDEAAVVAVSPDGKSVYVTALSPFGNRPSGISVFDRASDGTLTQKPGAAGCTSDTGGDGDGAFTCASGRALGTAVMVVVSPDGGSVYVTGPSDSAIAIFDRAADGTLTQKSGTAGCVSADGEDGKGDSTCADGRAILSVLVLALSPDGRSLYATTIHRFNGVGISVFDRVAGDVPTPTQTSTPTATPTPTPTPLPAPPPDPGVTPPVTLPPFPAAPSPVACAPDRLVLTDVFPRGGRTRLLGVAPSAAVGKRVEIRSTWNGRRVARALVGADRSFTASAPLPPRRLRASNATRYVAVLGRARSQPLKFARRMYVTSITASGRTIRFSGTVTRPLGRPPQQIVVRASASCSGIAGGTVVATTTPSRSGAFTALVELPPALANAPAVFLRAGTRVPKAGARTRKLSATFTLIRGIRTGA